MDRSDPCNLDQKTLDAIRAEGDDLSTIREVKFWLYFNTENDADRAAIDCLAEGYCANVMELTGIDDEFPWQCTPWVESSLSLGIIREHGKIMMEIADRYQGDYDGWEAAVIVTE